MESGSSETPQERNKGQQQPQQQSQQQQPQQQGEKKGQKKYYYNRYRRRQGGPGKPPFVAEQKKSSFKKVSVVVPLLNEEESLRPLYFEIKKTISGMVIDYEVIFIDDGSTDQSLKVIKELAKTDPKIRYISFRKNYGKSAALHIGFKQVTGDVVVTMDADLQDDPKEIPNMLKKLEEGNDLVSGWKRVRFDPIIKRHSSKFFNFVTGLLTGIKIHDFNCGLKAYRKEVVKNLNVYGELHRYLPVLADWEGFKITEVPVQHHARRFGKTKFGISRFFKGFIDLLTVMFTTRYIKRPMHLFGFLGALSFFVGFLVNGYLTYEWLFGKTYISNRPLLFLGILLIIVGVQFFSVGLLGEIMVHNTRDDKIYEIREKS